MDDLGVRHGFYTTYNVTIFVRRTSDTNFEVSPPILHSTKSTEGGGKDGVSVRECFLYLAMLANSVLWACIGRHNGRAYRREAQFGCGVLGHTAGPHKPFVSKFVWPRLLESCLPPIFP
jgi:hypothetical protein